MKILSEKYVSSSGIDTFVAVVEESIDTLNHTIIHIPTHIIIILMEWQFIKHNLTLRSAKHNKVSGQQSFSGKKLAETRNIW